MIYALASLSEEDFEAYLNGSPVTPYAGFKYEALEDKFAEIAGTSRESAVLRRERIEERERLRIAEIELARIKRLASGAAFAVDPRQLVEEVSGIGMSVDIPWRQSRLDNSYLAILTQPFGANELSCMFESDESRYVSVVTLEAEFYRVGQSESEILDHFARVVGALYPAAPEPLLKAIAGKDSWSGPSWTLERKPHLRNGGYDLQLVGAVEESVKTR